MDSLEQQVRVLVRTKQTHFLSDKDIWAIRKALRTCKTQREVARAFGISDAYVSNIKLGTRRINMQSS